MRRLNRPQVARPIALAVQYPALPRLAVGATIIVAGLLHTLGRLLGA